MNSSRPKYEGWLYWVAFLIALGFRLIQLGAKPLTDSEAQLALQALHIAQGRAVILSPLPAYILFTSILFFVVEAANFMARFVPAIAGSALVFAPWYFRERLKPRFALTLAFLFAFDPGLVALSRQSNGTILAVTFLLFAWGMCWNGYSVPAGIFAALALLSGPSIWSGNVKKKGEIYPLAWDLAGRLAKVYTLKDEKIWCQDDIRLAPYGLGNAWESNTFHHYCLQFRNG